MRNRLKIQAAIGNARALLAVQEEFGSFDALHLALRGRQTQEESVAVASGDPAHTAESDAMSKDLKRRGFSFVGSTICYAFMQAAGLVNDHTVDCFRYRELG